MEQVNSIPEMNAFRKNNEMLLVYFGNNTCSVCRAIMPKINSIIASYPFIKAVKIDAQKSTELSASYGVFTVPVVMLFIKGKETIREAGIISLISLEEKISRYYSLFYEGN
ncbi:thioredoxin family protein [Acetobacterium bakii]|uniref:Thioredoxin n=1 Tax=Acetobacterium bakii TaxID=52689 RepID=A0A0L6TXT0_9FIRM|nr:thioredoxin family protein [Acetobacterium bakii]KNZ40867.1 thioredoxin [Acetobacterium bakii]